MWRSNIGKVYEILITIRWFLVHHEMPFYRGRLNDSEDCYDKNFEE